MDTTNQPAEQKGVCPYCGSNRWHNSWGFGNASCDQCGKEFNLRLKDGLPVGEPAHQLGDN
jgi:uncharacterized protein (DUF983 family)